jgi:hypothetical protein
MNFTPPSQSQFIIDIINLTMAANQSPDPRLDNGDLNIGALNINEPPEV